MAAGRRDHAANDDDADRHLRPRRVPAAVAVVVAAAVIVLLAYLRGGFR
ncbi:MAG TPA: hypothetical protein VJP76_08225 [Candidatus Tumulicola sp.]|nr:hypothetical protein [Candidatus Tumulicola sp.]